jgi:hypothetical protein
LLCTRQTRRLRLRFRGCASMFSFAKTPHHSEFRPRNNVTSLSTCLSFQTHFEFWRRTAGMHVWIGLPVYLGLVLLLVWQALRGQSGRSNRCPIIVNNAGYTLIGSLEETRIEEAKQLFDTNFFGVLRMTQAVLPLLREQRSGRIINIGSVVGFVPAPYQGIYSASKHALEGYSESLDHEVRPFGVPCIRCRTGFHAHEHRKKQPSCSPSAGSLC